MRNFIQTILLIVCFCFATNTQAQTINIPDANFKGVLLLSDTTSYIAFDINNNPMKIDINDDGEIEQNEALLVYELRVSLNISDMTGIEYFTNLTTLHCENNVFSSLDLSALTNLKQLFCGYNNGINSLDVSALTNLVGLDCHNNLQQTSLNVSGLTNLESINCSENQLLTLDVSGLTSLTYLFCSYNQLSSLNVSGLTNLINLSCVTNHLNSLDVSTLINLESLACTDNQISSLDVAGLTNLTQLFCGYNQIKSLDLSRLSILHNLYCYDNQLTSLDLTNQINLEEFNCTYNPLRTIYLKNGVDNSAFIRNNRGYNIFIELPNLSYICADSADIDALKYIADSSGYSNVIINSFCSSTLNGSYYTLMGNAKLDLDNNGCSAQDAIYPNFKIKINNATDSGYIIANAQGDFSMTLDSGTYTLTPQFLNNYFKSTPISATITLPDTITPNFCITPNGIHNDVSVTLIPISAARPGFSDATYKIVYANKGTTTLSGTVLFTYDKNKQDYISATETPNNISNGELTFNFNNFNLFETREIIVTMRTNSPSDNPAVNVGNVLNLSVTLTIANAIVDENLSDNSQTINQTVVGSFDPNDKTCLEGDIITPTVVGDFVNYLIRFENTGTANAENVVVTDFIDLAKFDISTLELTSTSHSCKTVISNGNKVQFVFDNINLPFTEPNKHGYVAFKIKTKNNLVVGDSLKNTADIYFDYNLPINTNTATTKISTVTAIKNNSIKEGSLSVFPNPSNGNFTINFESKGMYPIVVKIIDLKGSIVYESNIQHAERSIILVNHQNLSTGLYQINITSGKDNWIQKLTIVK